MTALQVLDYPPDDWEFIFVNNASSDDTAEVFERAATRTDIHYTYIDEPNGGLAKARNAGARSAQNDVLVFSDDDCFVSPTLLHDYAHEYQTHDVGFVGGQVRPYLASGPRLAVQERQTREHIPAYCFLRTGLIHGANMSIRREALLECGALTTALASDQRFLVVRMWTYLPESCSLAGPVSTLQNRVSGTIIVNRRRGQSIECAEHTTSVEAPTT